MNQNEILDEVNSIINGDNKKNITVKNDDHNTFEHVIGCLIVLCNHEPEQAEQCANLIHMKGKYIVKSGTREEVFPIVRALRDNGLVVEVS